jgi:prepilin-type processing-associated H-X9-DG protein
MRQFVSARIRRATKSGFTVLELLVAVGAIAMLAALLLPALMAARESARRTQCVNHLRQLGVAAHMAHDRSGSLPHAWRPAARDPRFAYGWGTQLLPDIEQDALRRRLPVDRRPELSIEDAAELTLPTLLCPSDILEPTFELTAEEKHDEIAFESVRAASVDGGVAAYRAPYVHLPTANYVGVFGTVEADDFERQPLAVRADFGDGPLVHGRSVELADLERGASHTLLIGERTMATVPSTWLGVDLGGLDAACRVAGSAMTTPNCSDCDECEFTSRHVGGANFVWADGHVELVADDVDAALYRRSARRDDVGHGDAP